jgi:protein-L-isoaspartate(D-aspartate) O-methyltransferase
MVSDLLAKGRILSPAVERAFRAVPRHLFLPDLPAEDAYRDEAVTIKWVDGTAVSSASQPSMMAIMLEQLDLRPGHRVLEVGAGTGYNAALMAELVGPEGTVVALDIDDDLVADAARNLAAAGADRVVVATRDGALGYPELAPYDRIVLTVGSWDIQPAWWDELAEAGRLLLPLSVRGSQLSIALDHQPGPPPWLRGVSVRGCAFVRLRGQGAGPATNRVDTGDGIIVPAGEDDELDPARLRALLEDPGPERPAPAPLAPIDLWDGLGLWLAVREPRVHRVLLGPEARHLTSLLPEHMDGGTIALIDERGMAAVAPRGPVGRDLSNRFPIGLRAFGPDGPAATERLAALIGAWVRAGRPAATELSVSAYPAGVEPPPSGGALVRKRHSTLLLDWSANPMAGAPILER